MKYQLINRNGIVRLESENIQEINAIAGKNDTIKDETGAVLKNPAAPAPKQTSHLTAPKEKFKPLTVNDLIIINDITSKDEETVQVILDALNKFFIERA